MKINAFAGVCLLVILLSCKKSGTTINNTNSNHRNMVRTEAVTNHYFSNTVNTFTYTYNDANLIEKIQNDDGTASWFTFTYFHDYIVQQYYDRDGIPRLTDTLFLNENGYVASDHWAGHIQKYTYDDSGFRITEENRNGNDLLESYTNTIENGNCVKIIRVEYECGGGESKEITFLTDKLNSVTWTQMGQPYYGQSDINLIDHVDYRGCTGIYRTDTYSYVFNQDGLIVQKNVKSQSEDYSVNYTYY